VKKKAVYAFSTGKCDLKNNSLVPQSFDTSSLNHLYMTNLEDRVAHMKALNYTLLHLFICMGQKGNNKYIWLISLALKISYSSN
jgi:hypothetical protein